MFRSEESYLNELIDNIKTYASKNIDAESFYNRIDELKIHSLQKTYIQKDIDFLNDINSILSIIISIVTRPIITVTSKEIIVRNFQASNLSNEDFKKTMSDASLWKHQGLDMVPSKVYYREYTDEIKTYENYFIVQLINAISKEVENYSSSFSSIILKLNENNILTNGKEDQNSIIGLIDNINRKLLSIKSTHFYKFINKDKRKIQNVTPTNVLLTNRLYNACFRFYKELLIYGDSDSINKYLTLYYYCLIIKYFERNDFLLIGSFEEDKNIKIFNPKKPIEFERKDISVSLYLKDNNLICLKIFIGQINKTTSLALLVSHDLNAIDPIKVNNNDFSSFNFISIWEYGYIENNKKYFLSGNPISEEKMIELLFLDHYKCVTGSAEIYSKYCPICKRKEVITDDNNFYQCSYCNSTYFIDENKTKNNILFTKIRRVN